MALGGVFLGGCTRPRSAAPPDAPPPPPTFEDVTRTSGLRFRHHTGAAGRYFMPETMGAGCAFLDYNHDGWPDILLLNGADWSPRSRRRFTPALYRNDHGRFTEVTRACGLDVQLYAMGCAAADYDNDGWTDLVLTGVGTLRLLQNREGRFVDATARAGLSPSRWSAGAVWLDYDRDGWVDLFLACYVDWTPETDRYCTLTGKRKSYCTPQDYDGLPCLLYRNRGDGTFEDVSGPAGIRDHVGKSLGALAIDYDEDGWPDIFVANDTEPNFLFRNTGRGTFEEIGLQAGCALGETGRARAGMGVDAADIDHSGRAALAVTNFAGEGAGLFVPTRDHVFVDEAVRRNVFGPTQPYLGFGVCFLDANLDGWPDLFVANGHVHDDVASFQPEQRHAQPPVLLLNRNGRFYPPPPKSESAHLTTARLAASPPLAPPMVARGAAVADFDRDGRPDILISANGGAPCLLRNTTPGPRGWLRLTLQGRRSNRSAIGARVSVRAGDQMQTQWVRAGSSYGSQNELALTFCLPGAGPVEEVGVRWPSGATDRWSNLPPNRAYTLVER